VTLFTLFYTASTNYHVVVTHTVESPPIHSNVDDDGSDEVERKIAMMMVMAMLVMLVR